MKKYIFIILFAAIGCDFSGGSVLDSVKNDTREQNGLPNLPLNFQVSDKTYNSINLSWQDNSKIEDGYVVEVSTDGTNFSELTRLGENIEEYIHSNLTEITKYYYKVSAYNKNGITNSSPINTYTGIGNKLIAHYKFEENCNDETGIYNAQTYSNAVQAKLPGYVNGPAGFGKAISFEKQHKQFLTVPTTSDFDINLDQTISFWFCSNPFPADLNELTYNRIITRGTHGSGGFTVFFNTRNLILQVWYGRAIGNTPDIHLAIPLIENTWVHFAFTFEDETKVVVYKNGSKFTECNFEHQLDWDIKNLILSKKTLNNTDFIDGSIDDLRIYEGIVSEKAIQCIFNGEL